MVAQELTTEEIIAAKKAGINLQQFFAVSYNEDSTPIAIFDSKLNAIAWKDEMCRTALVIPYALQVK